MDKNLDWGAVGEEEEILEEREKIFPKEILTKKS